MEIGETKVSVNVPCNAISVSVGPLSLSVSVSGDKIFVWTSSDNPNSPHGIAVPVGRVVAALDKLIDDEFARTKA